MAQSDYSQLQKLYEVIKQILEFEEENVQVLNEKRKSLEQYISSRNGKNVERLQRQNQELSQIIKRREEQIQHLKEQLSKLQREKQKYEKILGPDLEQIIYTQREQQLIRLQVQLYEEDINKIYIQDNKIFVEKANGKIIQIKENDQLSTNLLQSKIVQQLTLQLKKSLQEENSFQQSSQNFESLNIFQRIVSVSNRDNPIAITRILRFVLTFKQNELIKKIQGCNFKDPRIFLPCFVLLYSQPGFKQQINKGFKGFNIEEKFDFEWAPHLLKKIIEGISLIMTDEKEYFKNQRPQFLFRGKRQKRFEEKVKEKKHWDVFTNVSQYKKVAKKEGPSIYQINFQSYGENVFYLPMTEKIFNRYPKILKGLDLKYKDQILLLPGFKYQVKRFSDGGKQAHIQNYKEGGHHQMEMIQIIQQPLKFRRFRQEMENWNIDGQIQLNKATISWKYDGATGKYDGNIFEGSPNGKGKLQYPSGDYIIGEWKNGNLDGKAIHYYQYTRNVHFSMNKNGRLDGLKIQFKGQQTRHYQFVNGKQKKSWIYDRAGQLKKKKKF